MKKRKHSIIIWPLRIAAIGLTFLYGVTALLAQDNGAATTSSSPRSYSKSLTSSSVHESKSSEIPRVWGGFTGSYLPFKVVSTKSTTNASTGEAISSKADNGEAGYGAMLNFRVFSAYWLNLGATYRFAGYDTTDAVNSNTIYLERTRARFLDFPALIRYTGPHFRWSKYSFYEIGGAVRYATHVDLRQSASNGIEYYCCAPPSTTAIRRTIEGVVVGTGVAGRDDFGIVVSPEVRYTHWMADTFRSPTIATMRNQLEVSVSFGF